MSQISLDDIRLFVSVVQAGSLSAASDLTGVPASRLSRRLTQLENSLGTQLINRGKKGVSLNELGEHFLFMPKICSNKPMPPSKASKTV